jgi:hypothetical protein
MKRYAIQLIGNVIHNKQGQGEDDEAETVIGAGESCSPPSAENLMIVN